MDDFLKLDLDSDFNSLDLSKQNNGNTRVRLSQDDGNSNASNNMFGGNSFSQRRPNLSTTDRGSDFGLDMLINKDKQKTPSNSPAPKSSPAPQSLSFEPSFKSNMISNAIKKPTNSFAPNTLNLSDDLEIDMDVPGEGITILKENQLPSRNVFEPPSMISSPSAPMSSIPSMSSIPTNTFISEPTNMPPRKTFEEIQREKAILLRKMEKLKSKGHRTFRNFDMNSDYEDIKFEYESVKEEAELKRSVKSQKDILITTSRIIEHASQTELVQDFTGKVELEGWSEHIMETADDEFEEIFEDLHEKYGDFLSGRQYPEVRLVWALGQSAMMFHLMKKYTQSMPGLDVMMKNNPALMQEFGKAAAGMMSQQSPAYRNLVGEVNRQPRDMNGPDNLEEIMSRLPQ